MQEFLIFLLKCFYLMLPAYFANMAPVIANKINIFAFPLDFGIKIGKKPVLGKNKTFRGLVFGVIFAVVVAYAQFLLYRAGFFRGISLANYNSWLTFGLLMGLGALIGDAVKSFFKRRVGINPGEKFIPFDQIDFVIGAMAFVMPIFAVTWKIFIVSVVLSAVLDIFVNHASFYLGIRKERW